LAWAKKSTHVIFLLQNTLVQFFLLESTVDNHVPHGSKFNRLNHNALAFSNLFVQGNSVGVDCRSSTSPPPFDFYSTIVVPASATVELATLFDSVGFLQGLPVSSYITLKVTQCCLIFQLSIQHVQYFLT
jgi:hypothetical protein